MIKAGIVGVSGYMGGEALRVLLEHPYVEIAWTTSRSGGSIEDYPPNLYGVDIPLIHPDDATPCDVVFLIGLDVDEKRGRIVVFSVLDSIGKGGAQVGIENMNLMFGFDRTSGLERRGLHPA